MSTTCTICGSSIGDNPPHSCSRVTAVPSAVLAASQSGTAVAQMPNDTSVPAALASNIAAALAYAFGFISGIAFLLLEPYKRDAYVRFHAWQSTLFSLAWVVFWIPLSIFTSTLIGGMAVAASTGLTSGAVPFLAGIIGAASRLINLAGFAYWVFLLYKAFSKQLYQIPLIGKFAAAQAAHEIG